MISQYEFLTKNVKLYYGNVSDIKEGWYILNGQTVNSLIYGLITLPDLIGKYPYAGTFSNNNKASSVGTAKWQWVSNSTHSHQFNVNVANLSGGSHTHSTWSFNNRNNNLNSNNVSNIYSSRWRNNGGMSGGNSSISYDMFTSVNGNRNNRNFNSINVESNSHSHYKDILFNYLPNNTNSNNDIGAHNHNLSFSSSNTDVRPDTLSLIPIIYLGA